MNANIKPKRKKTHCFQSVTNVVSVTVSANHPSIPKSKVAKTFSLENQEEAEKYKDKLIKDNTFGVRNPEKVFRTVLNYKTTSIRHKLN